CQDRRELQELGPRRGRVPRSRRPQCPPESGGGERGPRTGLRNWMKLEGRGLAPVSPLERVAQRDHRQPPRGAKRRRWSDLGNSSHLFHDLEGFRVAALLEVPGLEELQG